MIIPRHPDIDSGKLDGRNPETPIIPDRIKRIKEIRLLEKTMRLFRYDT
ncbi:hypothetical protein AVEN_31594-1, partial [Araneus ventricosus]